MKRPFVLLTPFVVITVGISLLGQTRETAQTTPAPLTDKILERVVQDAPRLVPNEQPINNVVPRTINIPPNPASPKPALCAIPLLQVKPDPKTDSGMKVVPPPPTDPKFVVKPAVPACPDKK